MDQILSKLSDEALIELYNATYNTNYTKDYLESYYGEESYRNDIIYELKLDLQDKIICIT